VHAWFEHQNSMVMYSYMLGLPLLAAALTTRRRKQMALYLAGFCAAAFTTILSLSRGGLGAMAAGILIVVCLILWDQVTLRRLVIIGTLGVLSLIPIGKSAGTIIERFTDPATHVSNEAREILNATSREMVRDYPVFGTGWNTYTVMIHPPYKYSNLLYDWELARGMRSDSHDVVERGASESWYYLLLAETGLVGTTAMFAFILITLFWCARSVYFYRRTVIGAVAIGLLAGIGMNYLQSNLERVLTQPKNLVAWMICLGIIARLEWWRRNPSLGPIQAQPALQPTEPVD
jgi:O-antigen ligase